MSQALVNYSVPDMERMALAISHGKLFGVVTPDQALTLCLVAQAEGRHPASAAQDYHIIQGRPSKKADAMLRDFLASGGKVQWHTLSDEIADATFAHPAGGTVRIAWDMARVKKAGIKNADMYGKFPRQMLRSRTVSEGVRTVFPMATSGMYVPEEVEDIAAEKRPQVETSSAPTIEGEVVSDVPQIKSSAQAKRDGDWLLLTGEIDRCATLEQLDILLNSQAFTEAVKPIPRQWKKELQDYAQTHEDALKKAAPVAPNFDEMEPADEPV